MMNFSYLFLRFFRCLGVVLTALLGMIGVAGAQQVAAPTPNMAPQPGYGSRIVAIPKDDSEAVVFREISKVGATVKAPALLEGGVGREASLAALPVTKEQAVRTKTSGIEKLIEEFQPARQNRLPVCPTIDSSQPKVTQASYVVRWPDGKDDGAIVKQVAGDCCVKVLANSIGSSGSGFVVVYENRPYVVTCNHVVVNLKNYLDPLEAFFTGSANNVMIVTVDGDEIVPDHVYSCPFFDVAALEIDWDDVNVDSSLKLCMFGNSAKLGPGDELFGYGSPKGQLDTFQEFTTSKIYRRFVDLRLNRMIRSVVLNKNGYDPRDLLRYIQVNGGIQQGFSGGLLFDEGGPAVGMICATSASQNSDSGAFGYAIPIEDVLAVVRKMIKLGEWKQSYFGVRMNGAQRASDAQKHGVEIVEVAAGSPASRAGLRPGDKIQSINGDRVSSMYDVSRTLALSIPGESGMMEVERNGALLEFGYQTVVAPKHSGRK